MTDTARRAYSDRLAWIEAQGLGPNEEFLFGLVANLERASKQGVPGLRVEVDWPAFIQGLKDAAF